MPAPKARWFEVVSLVLAAAFIVAAMLVPLIRHWWATR